ncbi:MAG: hypothetical protein C4K49_09275 [Candidatus Thorarchaeota archaeon]|nr:MAG: hypothetical protein C4K49_09275 [Candidatus Thorarchaeota archaeon]
MVTSERDVIEKRRNIQALKNEKLRAQRKVTQQMRMGLADDEKELVAVIGQLGNHYDGLIVVVEGRSDEKVLRALGLNMPIVKTQSRLGRPELIDKIADLAGNKGQVLVLTDFDPEGRELSRYLQRELEAHRIKVLRELRRRISHLMGGRRCVEDLTVLFKKEDVHGMAGLDT